MKKVIVIDKAFGPYRAGTEIKIDTTENGVPTQLFWRRRLRDAKTDNCVHLKTSEVKMNKTKIENKSLDKGDKS